MKRVWMALLLAGPIAALGQTDSLVAATDTVEVFASRIVFRTVSPLRVVALNQDQLGALPAVSLNDVLSYVPGLDLRERGPFGVQADISIRGGTFNQTLVLLDGLKLSDPQTGHHNLNLALPLAALGRVEILKGPGARALGQNALAGAVNFVPTTELGPSLTLQYGQYDLANAAFSSGFTRGTSRHLVGLGYTSSAGYAPNTDFGISQAVYYGRYALGKQTLTATGAYSARHFGADNFYFPAGLEYETTESSLAALGLRGGKVTGNLYYRRHFDDYRAFRDRPTTARNRHTSEVVGLDGTYRTQALGGTTATGFDVKNERILSNNLGSHQRWTTGLYLEQAWELGPWVISPGVYINWFSDFGWAAYPGLDAAYTGLTNTKLYAGLGRAYRIPTYIDLYLNTSSNRGNPELEPERAWTYELGGEWRTGPFDANLALFQRSGQDLIDYARPLDAPTTDPFTARNVNDLTTRGLEAGLGYTRRLGTEREVLALEVGYTFLEQNNAPCAFTSRYVFDFLRHQVVARARLTTQRWALGPQLRYEKRVNVRENYLLDLRLGYTLGPVTLTLEGTNLFNRPYADIGGVTLPGRWLRGGIVYQFARKPIAF